MSLRVISGSAKGRKLKSVPGDTTRPVMDRVKQALFNILANDVSDSAWWDMFAGTGAIGVEALSRGAAFVFFTDLNREPIETIKDNVAHCGFSHQSEIRRADALHLIASSPNRSFEYIYIAPPQYKGIWLKALQLLDENIDWLSNDGEIIIQLDPKEYVEVKLNKLEEFEQRKYGNTLLVFYENKNDT